MTTYNILFLVLIYIPKIFYLFIYFIFDDRFRFYYIPDTLTRKFAIDTLAPLGGGLNPKIV